MGIREYDFEHVENNPQQNKTINHEQLINDNKFKNCILSMFCILIILYIIGLIIILIVVIKNEV